MTPGETLRGGGPRRWLYDPKIRALAAQILTVLAIALFAGWIVHNTVHNLTVRGIASGFGFLKNPPASASCRRSSIIAKPTASRASS